MFDLHNHILPGIDDGSPSWGQSLAMARLALEDGIRGVVCTPHWVFGCFDNSRSVVLDSVDRLRDRLVRENIPIEIFPGAELRLDLDIPRKIEAGELLTINDTGRYALIELPEEVLPLNLESFFWELQMQSVTPVIGHPERNYGLLRDPARLIKLVEMGALTQITAASLLGRFGTEISNFAARLLKHHLVHVIATDAHGERTRTPRLTEGYRAAEKIVGKAMAQDLVSRNPRLIVQGEQLTPYDPIPFKSRSSRSPLKSIASFFGLRRR